MSATDLDVANSATEQKTATLYRMAMPGHICPFGLKSRFLLKRKGYEIEDHLLESRPQIDAFKKAQGVETTPQIFIDGAHIGGYTDLKKHLGYKVLEKGEKTYRPIIAIFASTALMALAIVWNFYEAFGFLLWVKWFLALSMAALAIQKLRDVGGFVNGFLGYDLLARRYVAYGYAYPFLELYTGVGMMALIGADSPLIWLVAPVGVFIGGVGAASAIKAVYIDKRELSCACVGGASNVPLGFVSLSENLAMLAMGLWMLAERLW